MYIMKKPPEAVRRWTSMKEKPITEAWIVRYVDGKMWATSGTMEEAEKKAREHHDAEIAAIA